MMSDHGFCVEVFRLLSCAFFFSSKILLHMSCNALVIARPDMLPWQRNMWHLCLPVEGSRATYAKSLKEATEKILILILLIGKIFVKVPLLWTSLQ